MTAINSNRAIRGPVTAVPFVAGKGVRLVADTQNNRWVVEADETVLWDGNGTKASSCTLSENPSNFERVKIYAGETSSYIACLEFPGDATYYRLCCGAGGSNAWLDFFHITRSDSTTLTVISDKRLNFGGMGSTTATYTVTIGDKECLFKVVGINRIAST